MRYPAGIFVCALIAVFTAAVSWFIYWFALGEIFQSGVHPDYWPASLNIAASILAAATGLAAALLVLRSLRRGHR